MITVPTVTKRSATRKAKEYEVMSKVLDQIR
jgi:hypothetical protein